MTRDAGRQSGPRPLAIVSGPRGMVSKQTVWDKLSPKRKAAHRAVLRAELHLLRTYGPKPPGHAEL